MHSQSSNNQVTILFAFFFVYSITSFIAAPLQIKDSWQPGETQTEISYKLTSTRQTDQIPEPDWLTLDEFVNFKQYIHHRCD